jgi:hypothetical protein
MRPEARAKIVDTTDAQQKQKGRPNGDRLSFVGTTVTFLLSDRALGK